MEVICGYKKVDTSKPLDVENLKYEDMVTCDLTNIEPDQTIKYVSKSLFTSDDVKEAVRRILSYAASECIIEYSKTGKCTVQPFMITFDCEEIQMRTGCEIVIDEDKWTALEYLTTRHDIHKIVGYELDQLVFKYIEEKLLVSRKAEK